jgi:hypothetical protein
LWPPNLDSANSLDTGRSDQCQQYEQEGSPGLVVLQGNWANGEMDHVSANDSDHILEIARTSSWGDASVRVQDDGRAASRVGLRYPLHRGRPCSPGISITSWVAKKRSDPPIRRRPRSVSIPCGRDARPQTSLVRSLRPGVTTTPGLFVFVGTAEWVGS